MSFMFVMKSWDRSVSIVAVVWSVSSRAWFLAVTNDFFLLQFIHTGFGSNPASYSGDTGAVPPELTYETYNLHLSTAEVKNE